MAIMVWDHSMPVTEARLRNRCLSDAEHLEIEMEIIRRIRARVTEYAVPELRRISLLVIAHLAGVEAGLEVMPEERKRVGHILSNRRKWLNATDWHAMLFYVDLIADAGRFAQERMTMIANLTTVRNRSKIKSVANNSATRKPRRQRRQRRTLRTVPDLRLVV